MKKCKDCGFRQGITCTSDVKCYIHERFKPLDKKTTNKEDDLLTFISELLKTCEEETTTETETKETDEKSKITVEEGKKIFTEMPGITKEEKKIFEEIYAPKPTTEDKTNPLHYKRTGTETIDNIYNILGEEAFYGYTIGNVIKYVSRYSEKNGVEDLEKARWYLHETIARMTGTDNEYRK